MARQAGGEIPLGIGVNCRRVCWRLLPGEFFLEFAREFVDVGGFAEALHLEGRGFHVDAGVLAEFLQQLEHHGELLFGEHANLKIKMRAPLGLASHAILADEHENGEENALRGDEKGQDAEWERIEGFDEGDEVEIHGAPENNQNHVEQQEFRAADELDDGVAVALGGRAAIESFLFQLGNGCNIELRRVICNLIRHGIFHIGSSGSLGIDARDRDRQAIEAFEIHLGVTALVCVGASVSAG
jgi:hypothetical protein